MKRFLPYLLSLWACIAMAACLPLGSNTQSAGNTAVDDAGVVVLHNPTEEQEASDPVPHHGKNGVVESGSYTDKDHVALYIHTYGRLPRNFIRKREAEELGWVSSRGNLNDVAPGKSIGGDHFGNYEGQLPKKKGRKYYECDINYTGGRRNALRIIYSSDGLVFYTSDHYQTFEQLY